MTVAATYLSVGFGTLGTVVLAQRLGLSGFGTLAVVLATAAFAQTLLDFTVDGTLVKYGCRYCARGDWGRLRRVFRRALQFKLLGGLLAAACLAATAPLAHYVVDAPSVALLLLVAALIPLAQAPEAVGAAALFVDGRHDVRALLTLAGTLLRLVALALGATFGVLGALVAIVVSQLAVTLVVGLVARRTLRTFPAAPERELGDDARELTRFTIHATLTTAVTSVRTALVPLLLGVPAQAGLFRAAQTVEQGFDALALPARTILLSELTRRWEAGARREVLRSLVRYALTTAAAAGAIVPVLLVAAPTLLHFAYGDEFGGAAPVVRLFVVAAAVQLVFSWTGPFAVAVGRPRLYLIVRSAEATVVLALVLFLGASAGAAGAATAVAIGSVGYGACWTTILVRYWEREQIAQRSGAPAHARWLAADATSVRTAA